MNDEVKLSLRSIFYRRKQYVSIFLVTMFGIAISLFCLFLINGMLNSMENKARIYYGGDYMILGGKGSQTHTCSSEIIPAVKSFLPEDSIVTTRYEIAGDESPCLFFEGVSSAQRFVKGIDFNAEKDLFERLNFLEGSSQTMSGSNGVLISKNTADKLYVHAGDIVTLMVRDVKKQINTVELEVKGIFIDSSVFGMTTAYMDLGLVRQIMGLAENQANRICVILPEAKQLPSEIEQSIQNELKKTFNMFPIPDVKDEFLDAHSKNKTEQMFAIIRLSANLQDVSIIVKAMRLISALIIAILTVIIVAGVSSTFRVVVMKRINEIGIYKAIGMKRGRIKFMLCFEVLLLLLLGCVLGFVVSLALCKIISLFTFSFIPAFDIFLSAGTLISQINPLYFVLMTFIICVTTELAVLFAVRRSVKITPCEALAVTE